MQSSLGRLQPQSPMSEDDLIAMGKRCVMERRRLLIDLDDVVNREFIELLKQYSIKKYNVFPEFKHKLVKGY